MKTTKFLTLMAAFAVVLSLNSCSKGATGDTGPAGPAGTNGVANISTTTVTVTPGSWSLSGGFYVTAISVSAITNYNTDNVNVDASTSTSVWIGLPVTNFLAGGDALDYSYDNGAVQLIYSGSAPTTTIGVKVTVIPPQ